MREGIGCFFTFDLLELGGEMLLIWHAHVHVTQHNHCCFNHKVLCVVVVHQYISVRIASQ